MLKKIIISTWVVFLPSVCNAEFKQNTDITNYLNQQLKLKSEVSVPAGSFKIDAEKSIILKNNSTLLLDTNTVLSVIPNKLGSYRVFKIKNVENVKISGGKVVGDKYTHLGKTGEWGMGVEIIDSQNIAISNMKINKMWGDAIYVGTNGKNSNNNIMLSKITMDDNRRQGISIISAKNLKANNITVSNTKGAKPSSGIDIEPNNKNTIIKNILLSNIYTKNNDGAGIQIGLSRYNNGPLNININNHIDSNSSYGMIIGAVNKDAKGTITINNVSYKASKNQLCVNSWTNQNFNIVFTKTHKFDENLPKFCKYFLNHSSINFR